MERQQASETLAFNPIVTRLITREDSNAVIRSENIKS
jgi:hypothetical protein